MKSFKNQHGFTLVEIVIVLAITAMLIAGAITASGGLRQETSFNTAVDQVHNRLVQVQNEAFTGVKAGVKGEGKSTESVFGKLVHFDPANKSSVKAYTLIGDAEDSNATLQACDEEVINLPNGIEFGGGVKQSMIFTRETNSVFASPNPDDFAPTASCSAPVYATGPLNGGASPPPPPPPPLCPAPLSTPVGRDCKRIADLDAIHAMLVSYANANGGKLPTTSAYGDVDSGGWDYSSQGGVADTFLPFLSSAPPRDPLDNGSGDVFYPSIGGAGNAYGYYCYSANTGWPSYLWDKMALGVKLERPSDYATDPRLMGEVIWYVPGIFESGFTCSDTVPNPPQRVGISETSVGFPAWHMFNTGGTKPSHTFTITNPASAGPINLTSVDISGATTSYSIISNNCANSTLAPGASCTVGVQFFPPSGASNNRLSNAGQKSATLTINNSSGVSSTSASLDGWAVSDRMGPGDQLFMSGDDSINAAKSLRGYNSACYSNAFACGSQFTLWSTGNLVLYANGSAVWMTGPTGGSYTEMQAGNGIYGLYTSAGAGVWGTNGAYSGVWLQLFTDGQLWRMQPNWDSSVSGYERIWP